MSWTTRNVMERNPAPAAQRLPAPDYAERKRTGLHRAALAVPSMRTHTTDEGWQIMLALEENGYKLFGSGVGTNQTDVDQILCTYDPDVVVVQDKREWDGKTAGPGFNERERFSNVHELASVDDVFKLTILKDAQNSPEYHAQSAAEIGCHAWIVYYHPDIVAHVAPYVRKECLVRTYHTIDADQIPTWVPRLRRQSHLLSGAVSSAYPLRKRLIESGKFNYLKHPGYGRHRCYTPDYLATLSQYRVAICTASRYGYALRKIIEATAVGCVVVTDLPEDEVLPYIDGNLVRVHNDATPEEVAEVVERAATDWNEERQRRYAALACENYDYVPVGRQLVNDIERMRRAY